MASKALLFVIPAQAGIRMPGKNCPFWIPACAGMTVIFTQTRNGFLLPQRL